jgi:uncharacterized repeat protein (TIGR01451 family)
MVLDLGGVMTPSLDTSAGNQAFVDELTPYEDPELYGGKGFLRSLEPGSNGEGWVGILRSMEPTIENDGVLPGPEYRTAYLGFGIEGVNDATGYNTREDLLGHLLHWLNDEVSLMVDPVAGAVNELTQFEAELTSSVDAEGVQYRWDFGDGSDIAVTSEPSIEHVYEAAGTYTVTVEATDAYGHKALDETTATVTTLGGSTKTVDKEDAFPGDELMYTLTLNNTSMTTATAVLTDVIPANTTYVTHTVGDFMGGVFTWSGTVGAGTSMTLTLTVQADDDLEPGTVITNVAEFNVEGTMFSKEAETTIWERSYLPLVFKSYSVTP